MISTLHIKTYPCYSTNSYPNISSRNSNRTGTDHPSEPPPSLPTSPHYNHTSRIPPPSPSTSPHANYNPRTPPPSKNPRTSNSTAAFGFSITKISRTEARKLLGVRSNFTKREVVLRNRMMARKYHPDKWNSSAPNSKEVRVEKFK